MNLFQKDLALSFLKAAILTILVVGAMAALSSCGKVSSNRVVTNQWRATVIKTGRHITVVNEDSLSVMLGDTVTVFYNPGYGNVKSYYYISNTPDVACDTATIEMYIDGKDTIYEPFEAWNVVLDRRIIK